MLKETSLTRAEVLMRRGYRIGAIELFLDGIRLRSGRISPHFFRIDRFYTEKESISVLVEAYVAKILEGNFRPDVIFYPACESIPFAEEVSRALTKALDCDIDYILAKERGENGFIAKASLEGKNVLIIDDTITTGNSARKVLKIIREYGGIPIGYIIALDRQERTDDGILSAAQEFEKDSRIPVHAIAKLADLVSFLTKTSQGNHDDSIRRGVLIGKILVYWRTYKGFGFT